MPNDMPRRKGFPTIKYLKPEKQGDVAMRLRLRRGGMPLEDELEKLYPEREKLIRRRMRLLQWRKHLAAVLFSTADMNATQARRERRAGKILRNLKTNLDSKEGALAAIKRQIEILEMQIAALPYVRQPVFGWQARAVELIMMHTLFNADGDSVASTKGAAMPTKVLQEQMRADGHDVGDRELRRFMRQVGVEPQQGNRSDLHPQQPVIKSLVPQVIVDPNQQLRDQEIARQTALTSEQRRQRVRRQKARMAKLKAYLNTPAGQEEQQKKQMEAVEQFKRSLETTRNRRRDLGQ